MEERETRGEPPQPALGPGSSQSDGSPRAPALAPQTAPAIEPTVSESSPRFAAARIAASGSPLAPRAIPRAVGTASTARTPPRGSRIVLGPRSGSSSRGRADPTTAVATSSEAKEPRRSIASAIASPTARSSSVSSVTLPAASPAWRPPGPGATGPVIRPYRARTSSGVSPRSASPRGRRRRPPRPLPRPPVSPPTRRARAPARAAPRAPPASRGPPEPSVRPPRALARGAGRPRVRGRRRRPDRSGGRPRRRPPPRPLQLVPAHEQPAGARDGPAQTLLRKRGLRAGQREEAATAVGLDEGDAAARRPPGLDRGDAHPRIAAPIDVRRPHHSPTSTATATSMSRASAARTRGRR